MKCYEGVRILIGRPEPNPKKFLRRIFALLIFNHSDWLNILPKNECSVKFTLKNLSIELVHVFLVKGNKNKTKKKQDSLARIVCIQTTFGIVPQTMDQP